MAKWRKTAPTPSTHTIKPSNVRRSIIDTLEPCVKPQRLERMKYTLSHRSENVHAILENLSDGRNGSACMRSIEGFGIQNVHVIESQNLLTHNNAITSGAHNWLSFERYNHAGHAVRRIKDAGYKIVATDLSSNSIPIEEADLSGKIAIAFGNESRGLSKLMRREADLSVHLPSFGMVQSYNVSVACGITLYHLYCQGTIQPDLSLEMQEELLSRWMLRDVPGSYLILERKGIELDDI